VLTGSRPRIAIAVPAWHAEAFVVETLASVLGQTYHEFSLHVSVDGNDGRTADLCASVVRDSRVTVVLQPSRLGWVGNTNAALRAGAGADFSLIMPHDDLIAPNYLETLVSRATAFTNAACIYSDMETFGLAPTLAGHGRFRQAYVTGNPIQRQKRLLAEHFSAVAFRGLVRQVGGEPLLLCGNDADDFAADTLYMVQIARYGDLLRVARPLYRKRYHAGNTHSAWEQWDAPRQCRAWRVHCRAMRDEALPCATNAVETTALIATAEARLVSFPQCPFPHVRALSATERNDQLAAFRGERRTS
jgi:glycosyltransferase involved in cell wall biosynthesis